MKKQRIIYLIIMCLCISCSPDKQKSINSEEMIKLVKISDSLLLENLNQYYENNLKGADFEYALILNYKILNNTSSYDIFYEVNLSQLLKDTLNYFTYLEDIVIFIQVDKNPFVVESKQKVDSLLKRLFQQQYDYYQKYGEFPPPITYSYEKWKYFDNKLVDKKMH